MIGRVLRTIRTPVTLLVLLGILCFGAWWGYSNVLKPTPPAAPATCIDQQLPNGELHSTQVSVSIFNGGDRRGLAGDVGRSMRAQGFRVLRATNTGEHIKQTLIVGGNANSPQVLLVKGFFKNSKVRVDNRLDGTVDVLVGDKYGGFNKKAPPAIAVVTGTACLPPQPSSAPIGS